LQAGQPGIRKAQQGILVSKSEIAARDRLRKEAALRAEAWKGKGPPVEAFEPIAQLITPTPPPWLKEHLRRWLPMHAYAEAVLQPSRAEMRAILTKVVEAASLLVRALGSSTVVEFLNCDADRPLPAPGNLQAMLVDFRDRAAAASRLPTLVDSKGRTKAGKGRAAPIARISAQAFCALLIAETWLHFRRRYPSPRNKKAAEAADIYWRLLGAERRSWGNDHLITWRRHFQAAAGDQSPEIVKQRAEYQRHLRESARMEALLAQGPSEGGP
jgi:hypothetical protein